MDVNGDLPESRSFNDLAISAGAARNTLSELREFSLSLGTNTVEHIRAHRVVFGKSMVMRWFADISAQDGIVFVKLNEGRRTEPSVIEINAGNDTSVARAAIEKAYNSV